MNRGRHNLGVVVRRARKILDSAVPAYDESEITMTHGRKTRRDNAYNREIAMPNMRTLTATCPDGTYVRKWTHRTYTHAIVGCKAGEWHVVAWCGSQELADKRLRQAEKDEVGYREHRARTVEGYDPIKHDMTDFQSLLVWGA